MLVIATALPALGFAPSQDVFIGVEPQRHHSVHPGRQAGLSQDKGWQDFLSGEGAGWSALFDEQAGTVRRAWGPGIAMDVADEATVLASVEQWLEVNRGLLHGVDLSDLQVKNIAPAGEPGGWNVSLARVVGGNGPLAIPKTVEGVHPVAGRLPNNPPEHFEVDEGADGVAVWRGSVELRIRQGALVMFRMDVHPAAGQVALQPAVSGETAVDLAIATGPASDVAHESWGARLMVLPMPEDRDLAYGLVWQTRTTSPGALWVSFIDAQTGQLLNVHNEVRYISGALEAEHDTRTVDGDRSVSALRHLLVVGESEDYSDANGVYDVDGDEASVSLVGRYVNVNNEDGDNAMLWLAGDAVWTETDATQAEIDSYVFLYQVREWGEEFVPDLRLVTNRLTSNVNLDASCNAYFDGNVNFYQSGGGCNNTGRIADVNYHEWGHGFHYYNLEAGAFDGSISEGIGDTISFLNTGDRTIAPYFRTDGGGIRDVGPNRVYPDDWVGEVHADGLIFAGAVWDLLKDLEGELGFEDARAVVSNLLVEATKGGPTIPEAYDEFIIADDDNGDVSDGTPHGCAIYDAFSDHGLVAADGLGAITVEHTPLNNQLAGGDHAVQGEVVHRTVQCEELSLVGLEVVYSVDGGASWQSEPVAVSGDSVDGVIPAQPAGTVVEYYFEGQTDDGDSIASPSGGSITPHTFAVGELVELYCEDFDADDGGYTHELVAGTESEGADDWQWGHPEGKEYDPADAHSGMNVWGNDLGRDGYDGNYQADKVNRLTSSAIDVQGHDTVVVQYRRWLSVEDGHYDRARIYADDDLVWENHQTTQAVGDEHHIDDQWVQHTLVVPTDGNALTLAWELDTDRGLHMGGWNIDDVCVYNMVMPEEPVEPEVEEQNPNQAEGSTDPKAGCGCATGSAGIGFWLFGLLATAARRRQG